MKPQVWQKTRPPTDTKGYDPMNAYGMELYAQTRLEQAHEDADIRRLLRVARAGTNEPSRWRRWLRLDRRSTAARRARLAEAA
jgi:hypothetical protein